MNKIDTIWEWMIINPIPTILIILVLAISIRIIFSGLADFVNSFQNIFINTKKIRKSQRDNNSNDCNINLINRKQSDGNDCN